MRFTFAPSLPLSLALSPPILVFLHALSASVVKKKFKGFKVSGSRVQEFKGSMVQRDYFMFVIVKSELIINK